MSTTPPVDRIRHCAITNSSGKSGISEISAFITGMGDIRVEVRLDADVPAIGAQELMPRIAGQVRKLVGFASTGYGEQPVSDGFSFDGHRLTLDHIPLEKLDHALGALVGTLSAGVSTREGQGITTPLLDHAAATKAIHELSLDTFVAELKTQGYRPFP